MDSSRAPLTSAQCALVEGFLAGDLRSLARCISVVENQAAGFESLLHALHEGVGRARRVGITGPPGAGKSTLTAELARRFRDRGERIGIIAVDPSSPFTGGALLGDRVRMDDLATEPGIFIRSMASRGSCGGLAMSTREVADLLDAFGFDRIFLETVGVGQSELEIASSADTTALVLVPESGDAIQAMKAGLMEVADLFVVNKADRPGADRLKKDLEVGLALRSGGRAAAALSRGHHGPAIPGAADAEESPAAARPVSEPEEGGPSERWEAPVLKTVASRGEGVEELASALDRHFAWLEESGALADRRRRAALEQARGVLERAVGRRVSAAFAQWVEEHGAGALDEFESPYHAGRVLCERILAEESAGFEG